jgi:hypothetical protein
MKRTSTGNFILNSTEFNCLASLASYILNQPMIPTSSDDYLRVDDILLDKLDISLLKKLAKHKYGKI